MFNRYYLLPLLAAFAIGCGDKASEDTGSEDTGSEDTGSEDTGSEDTGDSGAE